MKHLTILLLCGFLAKSSLSQSNHSGLFLGKYEGIEIRYLKHFEDTSNRVDRMNETWGKKKLTLDSNGTFMLEFPIPWPSTIIGDRVTNGNWVRIKDALILNSHYSYKDFMKVKERKTNHNHKEVKLKYKGVKRYYPSLSLSINNKTTMTNGKPWTYFPLDTVKIIEVDRNYKVNNHKWLYRTINSNSNYFVIWLTNEIKGNNFVVENYKLLIDGSSLIQIDKVFNLKENCFSAFLQSPGRWLQYRTDI